MTITKNNIMKPRAFKIWYSNKVITSYEIEGATLLEKWKNIPDEDVQVIIFFFDKIDYKGRRYKRIASGVDSYGMSETKYIDVANDPQRPEGHVKYGKTIDDDKFETLKRKATSDNGDWIDIVGEKGEYH